MNALVTVGLTALVAWINHRKPAGAPAVDASFYVEGASDANVATFSSGGSMTSSSTESPMEFMGKSFLGV